MSDWSYEILLKLIKRKYCIAFNVNAITIEKKKKEKDFFKYILDLSVFLSQKTKITGLNTYYLIWHVLYPFASYICVKMTKFFCQPKKNRLWRERPLYCQAEYFSSKLVAGRVWNKSYH